ncbi:MAG: 2-isopropylmalate synthase [Gemmatirosa sp.]|nr:2-isopropylmalate synthase [Gemmatirosa sp.]
MSAAPPPPAASDAGARVRVFDTTLRDGEQAPGCTMSLAEKLDVARQLTRMGVDIIEAGFPAASPGDADAVQAVAETIGAQGGGPVICGLARANEQDITVCARAIAPAPRRRLHTFLATSDIHLRHKLRMSRDEVLQRVTDMVTLARTHVDDVEFSPEDATRSDPDFLCDVLAAAIAAGATTLNIPDTVGYSTPSEYEALIGRICALAARTPGVVISTHCHDDLGMAVANSLAGVRAGARQVEVTINGIGERAGNASLEEVVMALRTRADHFAVYTTVETREITRASRLVSACTGVYVAPNKAVVGANAFAHEAGIHQDGMLKHRATYEIMQPEAVGADGSSLVLGKHSGRHALRRRLEAMGHHLDDERFDEAFARFKELADRKKVVDARDLTALANAAHDHAPSGWALLQLQVTSGTHVIPTATASMRAPDGSTRVASGHGSGPVDAACRAVNAVVGDVGELEGFVVRAVTEGIAAAGEVTVRVKDFLTGATHVGYGVHTDVVTASAEAYVDAVNRLFLARERDAEAQELRAEVPSLGMATAGAVA